MPKQLKQSEPPQCVQTAVIASTVYLRDCVAGMKDFPDNYFDLAIVDPPYGINATNMQMGSAPNRNEHGQYSGTSTAVKVKGRLNTGSGKLKNGVHLIQAKAIL